MMGALAELTSFSAAEIEGMTQADMQHWLACINLYRDEVKANQD